MASGKQAWLIVAGIGCGAAVMMVALAAVIGGAAFNRLRQGVGSAAAAHDAVIAEHGRSEDYRPAADGRIEPQRMEAFLAVRRRLTDSRRELLTDLAQLSAAAEEGALAAPGGVIATMRSGLDLLPGILADSARRSEALLAEGMGHGEYLYLYTLAYYVWLGHSPADGPAFRLTGDDQGGEDDAFAIREQRLERIRSRVNRRLRPMLRHQLEDIRSLPDADAGWVQALTAEIAALEAEAMRLPWQERLPPVTAAGLEPFRARLEASYTPLCNPLDTAIGP